MTSCPKILLLYKTRRESVGTTPDTTFFHAALLFGCLLAVSVKSILAQESLYVGSQECKPCHAKAYEIWAGSSHAAAQDRLPQDKQGQLRCLFCHATDAQHRQMNRYGLANVQCEACHGPGSRHIAIALEKDENRSKPQGLELVTEQTCKRCHTEVRSPSLRSFQYIQALTKIRHW